MRSAGAIGLPWRRGPPAVRMTRPAPTTCQLPSTAPRADGHRRPPRPSTGSRGRRRHRRAGVPRSRSLDRPSAPSRANVWCSASPRATARPHHGCSGFERPGRSADGARSSRDAQRRAPVEPAGRAACVGDAAGAVPASGLGARRRGWASAVLPVMPPTTPPTTPVTPVTTSGQRDRCQRWWTGPASSRTALPPVGPPGCPAWGGRALAPACRRRGLARLRRP